MLARAFPGAAGFYVDVGANDPDIDNVSRVFYERGWSGINIEPLSANSAELRSKRPRDINLEIAVGEEEGTITFYEIGKWHGYSTTHAALAARHLRQDHPCGLDPPLCRGDREIEAAAPDADRDRRGSRRGRHPCLRAEIEVSGRPVRVSP